MADQDLILCYHRVASPVRDPQLLAVTPEHFAAQMEILARDYQPATLDEITDRPGRGGRVAVTFDDGYADNLHLAAPILESCGVPATVYVVADNAATGKPFWWDELADLLMDNETTEWPEMIELPGKMEPIRLAVPRTCRAAPYAGETQGWSVLSPVDPGPGHFVYRRLYPRFQIFDPDGRECAMSKLYAILGRALNVPSARSLTPDELADLVARPGIGVGAHTLRHPVLSTLAEEEQMREIVEGATLLSQMIDRPLRHFSYPYGSPVHFDEHSVRIVREAGFASAVTTIEGEARAETDLLRLPRRLIRDWDAETFADRLKKWMQ